MKSPRRQVLAAALSLCLLAGLLLLVLVGNQFVPEERETLTLREIQVARPPPPPPPSRVEESAADASAAAMDLDALSADAPVLALRADLDVAIPRGELMGIGTGPRGAGTDIAIEMEFDGFNISELDVLPMVVSAPAQDYPRQARVDRVDRFVVELHILIDEEGRAYVVDILDNPYPQHERSIREFVSGVRFTPPTLAGEPVKAQFRWPVVYTTR